MPREEGANSKREGWRGCSKGQIIQGIDKDFDFYPKRDSSH